MKKAKLPEKGIGTSLLKRLANVPIQSQSLSTSQSLSIKPLLIEPAIKRVKREENPKREEPKPIIPLKYQTVYDTISDRLKQVIDKWIVMINNDLIQKLASNIQSPNRSSDIYFIIGPSGSGKSCIVNHLLNNILKIKSILYDEFADSGNRSETENNNKTKRTHPCAGFLMKLVENFDPFVLVIDGLTSVHEDFIHFLVEYEYPQYKKYALSNKSIIIMVDSMENYTLRHWSSNKGPTRWYVRSNLHAKERYMISEMIRSVCPLSSDDPIRAFAGDYRRMGIDLISCTREANNLYARNTNQVLKVASIFDVTQHLNSYPIESLLTPMLFVDEMDRLFPMVARNHFERIVDFKDQNQLDEVVFVTAQLSDMVSWNNRQLVEDDGDQHGLHIRSRLLDDSKRQVVFGDTNRMDVFALFSMMHQSNRRLGNQNMRLTKIEFEPNRSFIQSQEDRKPLFSSDQVITFACVDNKLERHWVK